MSSEAANPGPVETDEVTQLKAEVEKWKSFSRQHESRAKALERDALVFTVAKESGIPDSALKFLTAQDEAGLKQQAEELKQLIVPQATATPATATPDEVEAVASEPAAEAKPEPTRVINPLQGKTASAPVSDDEILGAEITSLFN